MSQTTLWSWSPNLEDAIERNPPSVSPRAYLNEAIALLGQAHDRCALDNDSEDLTLPIRSRGSCLLVVEGKTLLGIVTERDIVRLSANTIDFGSVTVADVMAKPVITLSQRAVGDVFAALFLFRRYRIRHLPIVDDGDCLVGVISHESIRKILRPANLLKFRRVSDVMATQVICAPPTATALELAQLMAAHKVSCVVITQLDEFDNERPIGIVTERDIVQFQAFQIDLRTTQAQAVMSAPLFLLRPDDSLWMAHQEMQKRHIGRLVVSWNWGQGLGIVTQTSLLRAFDPMEMYAVIENLQQTIQQLEATRSSSGSEIADRADQPQQSLSSQIDSRSIPAGNGARSELLALSGRTKRSIVETIANSNISEEQRRALLNSINDIFQEFNDEIRSYRAIRS